LLSCAPSTVRSTSSEKEKSERDETAPKEEASEEDIEVRPQLADSERPRYWPRTSRSCTQSTWRRTSRLPRTSWASSFPSATPPLPSSRARCWRTEAPALSSWARSSTVPKPRAPRWRARSTPPHVRWRWRLTAQGARHGHVRCRGREGNSTVRGCLGAEVSRLESLMPRRFSVALRFFSMSIVCTYGSCAASTLAALNQQAVGAPQCPLRSPDPAPSPKRRCASGRDRFYRFTQVVLSQATRT